MLRCESPEKSLVSLVTDLLRACIPLFLHMLVSDYRVSITRKLILDHRIQPSLPVLSLSSTFTGMTNAAVFGKETKRLPSHAASQRLALPSSAGPFPPRNSPPRQGVAPPKLREPAGGSAVHNQFLPIPVGGGASAFRRRQLPFRFRASRARPSRKGIATRVFGPPNFPSKKIPKPASR